MPVAIPVPDTVIPTCMLDAEERFTSLEPVANVPVGVYVVTLSVAVLLPVPEDVTVPAK